MRTVQEQGADLLNIELAVEVDQAELQPADVAAEALGQPEPVDPERPVGVDVADDLQIAHQLFAEHRVVRLENRALGGEALRALVGDDHLKLVEQTRPGLQPASGAGQEVRRVARLESDRVILRRRVPIGCRERDQRRQSKGPHLRDGDQSLQTSIRKAVAYMTTTPQATPAKVIGDSHDRPCLPDSRAR